MNTKKRTKASKDTRPFWKKLGPEAESIFTHIGKAADNMTHVQWVDLLTYGGLAALSVLDLAKMRSPYWTVGENPYPQEIDDWTGLLNGYGPPNRITNPQWEQWNTEHLGVQKSLLENVHWEDALVGPIGLKLATAMGGTPPVSQISGLAILAFLGVTSAAGLGVMGNFQDNLKSYYDQPWYEGGGSALKDLVKKDPVHFTV